MFLTRSLLALAPFLQFTWTEGAQHGQLTPAGSPITHLLATAPTGCMARELLTDHDSTWLLGMDGTFTPMPHANKFLDLERALVRAHLIDLVKGCPTLVPIKAQMLHVTNPAAFAAQVSAFTHKPTSCTLTLHQAHTMLARISTPVLLSS